MTRFVHVVHPTEHPGVVRAARAAASISQLFHQITSARGISSVLLAAVVSALVVAANQIVETWTERHLFVAWVVAWTVAFTALALLARPVTSAVHRLRMQLRRLATAGIARK